MYTNIKKEKIYICFHYDLSQCIDHSSLCYTLELCFLSILYLIACICQPPTPRPSISLPLPPLIITCLCSVWESVSTRQKQTCRYSEVNFFNISISAYIGAYYNTFPNSLLLFLAILSMLKSSMISKYHPFSAFLFCR